MKFEGSPQFDPGQLTEKVDKPEIGVVPEQKILERATHTHEAARVNMEKPTEKIEIIEEQASTHEKIEEPKEESRNSDFDTDIKKEQPHEPIAEKGKIPQQVIVNRQYIKRVGKQLRERLDGNISIENLSAFARQVGVEHVIETPLLRGEGGCGFTQELSDGSVVILYHGILPGTDKYYLSHEIAHLLLGHLNVKRSGIKQGLKQEWDADVFASSVTRLPQPLALLYCHILDGFIGKLYKLVGPLIKKRELKKIDDAMGDYAKEIKDAFE